MSPEEFTSFDDAKPSANKHIVVTNNLNAKNAHGEMSHVWMTTFWKEGAKDGEGIITMDTNGRRIFQLSHWKYA